MRALLISAALVLCGCEAYVDVAFATCDGDRVACPSGEEPACGELGEGVVGDCDARWTRPVCDDGTLVWCEPVSQ